MSVAFRNSNNHLHDCQDMKIVISQGDSAGMCRLVFVCIVGAQRSRRPVQCQSMALFFLGRRLTVARDDDGIDDDERVLLCGPVHFTSFSLVVVSFLSDAKFSGHDDDDC